MACRSNSLPRRGLLGLAVLLILFLVLVGQAQAVKKPIIIFARAFQPVGQILANGKVVKLQGKGDQTEIWETGDRMVIKVTLVQPQTGARGVGQHVSVHGVGHPINPNVEILVVAVGSSPRFRPGPAQAQALAFRQSGNQIIKSWSWTSNVVL